MANEVTSPRHPQTELEKEEAGLWRIALLFLVLLATGLAADMWERMQALPYHLGVISIAVLCVAIAFAGFAHGRRARISELKTLSDEIQDRTAVPTEEQLNQLGQLIAQSQKSFKELIDSIDDVAFAMNMQGKLRTVNRRMAELLNIPYTQVVGRTLDEFIDEPSRQDADCATEHFLEKRRWTGQLRVHTKADQRTYYFDVALNAIVKGDEVIGVSVLARDITEEIEKERRFTELFETLQEGVYFSTPEGKLLDGNAALVQLLGYQKKDELLAIAPADLNADRASAPALGRSADDQGGVRTREIVLRRRDGSLGTFLDTSRAVWDASGKIVRYQGTLVDITERRAMERALRRQESFQRSLLESFPDLILVVDSTGSWSFVSSRIRDILGYRPEEWLSHRLDSSQDVSSELVDLCRDVAAGRKGFGTCECRARHRDGGWRTMRATASPMYEADSGPNGVIVSLHDITVEKKFEQQIIQSERLAAMGQMIGGFAHELNNPLTGILGMSELLQDNEMPEEARKQLVTLQQQARRAADIVQNLLYFSRPPAPGQSQIDLNELLQRTLHLHAYSLRKSNITVEFDPQASLPAVSGDAHQLMQVFLNLMINAEHAIREVRENGTLRIRLAEKPNAVAIMFEDDGPGIPAEILPNIFDPFYTTKRPGRGTGLGLSICKAILREHHGNVEASSSPSGGAVFTVTLPAGEGTMAASGQS
ncbi:MAG TPA: PAS domain S-box protein [Terriglobales bacterium]